ncbi:hypothetical protein ZWY2020_017943 [Hordeum vulgare]|nr:hypothetical protein ZWY2020_017943 [Hordeum vulgare]
MLLGSHVHARDLPLATAPVTSVTAPASLPPRTANPTAMRKGILGWAGSLDLKVKEQEPEGSKDSMGDDDEADLKAAWCSGA